MTPRRRRDLETTLMTTRWVFSYRIGPKGLGGPDGVTVRRLAISCAQSHRANRRSAGGGRTSTSTAESCGQDANFVKSRLGPDTNQLATRPGGQRQALWSHTYGRPVHLRVQYVRDELHRPVTSGHAAVDADGRCCFPAQRCRHRRTWPRADRGSDSRRFRVPRAPTPSVSYRASNQ